MLWHFLLRNKKVEKFQLCLTTAASLFPFSFVTLLIVTKLFWPGPISHILSSNNLEKTFSSLFVISPNLFGHKKSLSHTLHSQFIFLNLSLSLSHTHKHTHTHTHTLYLSFHPFFLSHALHSHSQSLHFLSPSLFLNSKLSVFLPFSPFLLLPLFLFLSLF